MLYAKPNCSLVELDRQDFEWQHSSGRVLQVELAQDLLNRLGDILPNNAINLTEDQRRYRTQEVVNEVVGDWKRVACVFFDFFYFNKLDIQVRFTQVKDACQYEFSADLKAMSTGSVPLNVYAPHAPLFSLGFESWPRRLIECKVKADELPVFSTENIKLETSTDFPKVVNHQ